MRGGTNISTLVGAQVFMFERFSARLCNCNCVQCLRPTLCHRGSKFRLIEINREYLLGTFHSARLCCALLVFFQEQDWSFIAPFRNVVASVSCGVATDAAPLCQTDQPAIERIHQYLLIFNFFCKPIITSDKKGCHHGGRQKITTIWNDNSANFV